MRFHPAIFLALAAALPLHAQGATPCDFSFRGGASMSSIGGVEIATASAGVNAVCRSRNITLDADSGRKIGEDLVELFGHVRYNEPTRINLKSDYLNYSIREERVLVRGHVVATLPSGSTLVGPEATLLRAAPNVRTIDELTAVRSPTMVVAAKGDTAKPVTINATTIYMRGDSMIYGSRSVVINRVDLIARSDSVFLDGRNNAETMRLMFKPSVEGLQGRKFRLEGEIIDAYSKNRKLDRVLARG